MEKAFKDAEIQPKHFRTYRQTGQQIINKLSNFDFASNHRNIYTVRRATRNSRGRNSSCAIKLYTIWELNFRNT
jgi:hypothetical protein